MMRLMRKSVAILSSLEEALRKQGGMYICIRIQQEEFPQLKLAGLEALTPWTLCHLPCVLHNCPQTLSVSTALALAAAYLHV